MKSVNLNKMKKNGIITLLAIVFIVIFISYSIDKETSIAMDNLFKNSDIEVLDSLRLDESNVIYIYENSQIMGGSHTKFVAVSNKLSCDIKNKKILFQSSDIKGFQKRIKDTVFMFTYSNFHTQILTNGIILYNVNADTGEAKRFLIEKNLKYQIIKCN